MPSIFSKLLPKKTMKKGGTFRPSFLLKTRTGSDVSDDRRNQANTDLTTLRYGATTSEIMRDYADNSPDVSHAVESIMRFAITDRYTLVAKDLETDTIDPDATRLVQTFASRLNKLPPTFKGFSQQTSINASSESFIYQLLLNGTCGGELVLDSAKYPSHIQTISTNNLKYRSGGDKVIPYIKDGTEEIVLDTPAVKIISLSQDPETPYAKSWFKAAVQSVISSTEFTNDLRRSFRKASLPRVEATIDIEKFKQTLSPEILYDEEKFNKKLSKTLSDLEDTLNGLNPQDALVHFDIVAVQHLTAGNASNHENVQTHADLVNGQMSAGLHTLPSILGRGESQTTASTETVLFLKLVESLQSRVNELYSYLLTLACRLYGFDVTVDFKYRKPSLRPEIEEESFLSVRQSRVRELLSDGFISDEEASLELTGSLPSGNFTPMSGTGFFKGGNVDTSNLYSNTSVSGEGVNNTKDQKDRQQGTSKPKTNKTSG